MVKSLRCRRLVAVYGIGNGILNNDTHAYCGGIIKNGKCVRCHRNPPKGNLDEMLNWGRDPL